MIYAGILAGGIGSRMNISNIPKQFLNIGDKPIIIHTIEKFLLCNKIDKIYVGVNPDWNSYLVDIVDKDYNYLSNEEFIKLILTAINPSRYNIKLGNKRIIEENKDTDNHIRN